MGVFTVALSVLGLVGYAHAATNDQWAQRSIYQVITDRYAQPAGTTTACNITQYCGGTWTGLVEKLDYIQGMGFTAVQISPAQENIAQDTIYGEAFHGYWPISLESLNSHFGTPADLKNLSAELHARDMYLLVDVVTNEMAYDIGDNNMTSTTNIDYSVFTPFNSSSQYDTYCPITDWNNETQYQTCWLGYEGVATPRIKTTDQTIRDTLNGWIGNLVQTYNIDGIRLDGAKQIEFSFFKDFVSSAGVYTMGEVDDGSASFTCQYQSYIGGLENYPLYFTVISAFTAGKMSEMVDMIGSMRASCSSPQYLANFIENQDNPRFASQDSDLALAQNALAFTILADGIPKMYYGQEQHLTGNYSPYNRQDLWSTNYDTTAPLYTLTATLNSLRNHAISLDSNYVTNTSSILYTDAATYAARKGPNNVQIVAVLSNQGTTGGAYDLAVPGAADVGTNMTEVIECTTALAGTNGTVTVKMNKGQPRVLFPTSQMAGTGLCGYSKSTSTNSSGTSTSTGSSATSTKTGGAGGLRVPVGFVLGLVGMASVMWL